VDLSRTVALLARAVAGWKGSAMRLVARSGKPSPSATEQGDDGGVYHPPVVTSAGGARARPSSRCDGRPGLASVKANPPIASSASDRVRALGRPSNPLRRSSTPFPLSTGLSISLEKHKVAEMILVLKAHHRVSRQAPRRPTGHALARELSPLANHVFTGERLEGPALLQGCYAATRSSLLRSRECQSRRWAWTRRPRILSSSPA